MRKHAVVQTDALALGVFGDQPDKVSVVTDTDEETAGMATARQHPQN